MAAIGNMHHVGITVRDLESSLQWYERTFGVTREFIAHGTGPDLSTAVGVKEANLRFAFLRFGNCVVELLCYDNERDETFERSNADVGSTHVCIDVPDLQAAYDDLRTRVLSSSRHLSSSTMDRWPAVPLCTSRIPMA